MKKPSPLVVRGVVALGVVALLAAARFGLQRRGGGSGARETLNVGFLPVT
ncbi:MAG: hypothetical protein HY763_07185 [Planctomycetes bacterium]|nr:hypothetical protein [Planctomycetota bacterium]